MVAGYRASSEGVVAMEMIRVDEGVPESHPNVVLREGEPDELVPDHVWERIEQWVAHRWAARQVQWTVEGPGAFVASLAPADIILVEVWREGWATVEPIEGPYGPILPGVGPYRITATVGAGNALPAAVEEAARRLALYMEAEEEGKPGASSYSVAIGGGAVSENYRRNAAWMARAIHNSGAADLLRPWRLP